MILEIVHIETGKIEKTLDFGRVNENKADRLEMAVIQKTNLETYFVRRKEESHA